MEPRPKLKHATACKSTLLDVCSGRGTGCSGSIFKRRPKKPTQVYVHIQDKVEFSSHRSPTRCPPLTTTQFSLSQFLHLHGMRPFGNMLFRDNMRPLMLQVPNLNREWAASPNAAMLESHHIQRGNVKPSGILNFPDIPPSLTSLQTKTTPD